MVCCGDLKIMKLVSADLQQDEETLDRYSGWYCWTMQWYLFDSRAATKARFLRVTT